MIEHRPIALYLRHIIQEEAAGEVFQVNHCGVRWVGELQHGERADRLRVRRRAQRQYPEAEVRTGGQLGQPQQLRPHDRGPADLHSQHALAQNHLHLRRPGLVEDGLAPHPQRHPQVDVLAAAGVRRPTQHRAGIVLGLQQAGNHRRLEIAHPGRVGLKPDVGLEPGREHPAISVPPALTPCVSG